MTMLDEQVLLYNHSDEDQHAYTEDGIRHTIVSYHATLFDGETASAFLQQRSAFVRIHRHDPIPEIPGEATVWLANLTGSPFLPKSITLVRMNKDTKQEEEYTVMNPNCVPHPIKREMQQAQIVVDSEQGAYKESRSIPPQVLTHPPYMRLPYPKTIADWMLRRDQQMDQLHIGAIIPCRAPAPFEPNESWEPEDVYIFAEMMDAKTKWRNRFNFPSKAKDEDEKKRAFQKLLHAVYYRLIDNKFSPPPKEAFTVEKKNRKRRTNEASTASAVA